MCQVSSGELGLLDRHIDLGIDSIECSLEWAVDGAEGRKRGGEAWAQQAVVEAREEQGCAEAEGGDAIAEAVWQALAQALQAQPSHLISDRAPPYPARIAARHARINMP